MGKKVTIESSPGVLPPLSKEEKEKTFWTPDNLIDIFKQEAKALKREYEKRETIEKDSRLVPEVRRQKLIALGRRSGGLFLVKLWSAVDCGLRQMLNEQLEEDDDDTETRKVLEQELRELYLEIPRATAFEDKARLAMAIRNTGMKVGVKIINDLENIEDLAKENEEYALGELQLIRDDPETNSPLNYRRDETSSRGVFHSKEMPAFEARALLEDWRIQCELKFPDKQITSPHDGSADDIDDLPQKDSFR